MYAKRNGTNSTRAGMRAILERLERHRPASFLKRHQAKPERAPVLPVPQPGNLSALCPALVREGGSGAGAPIPSSPIVDDLDVSNALQAFEQEDVEIESIPPHEHQPPRQVPSQTRPATSTVGVLRHAPCMPQR